jgi:dipeptidyl aminopeptidase/acylaminoacyl peptidase
MIRGVAVLICGLVLHLVSGTHVSAQTMPEIHLEDFLSESAFSAPRLSPNGRYIAYYFTRNQNDGGDRLIVQDLDAPEGDGIIQAAFGEFAILGLDWANDERLLVTVGLMGNVRFRGYGQRLDFSVPFSRVLSFSRRTLDDPVVLFEGEGRRVERNLNNVRMSEVADMLPGQPDHVLMPAYRGDALHLWRVNVRTGEAEVVERGNPRTARWYTGPDGRAVMRIDVSSNRRRVSVFTRQGDSTRWRRSATYRTNELSEAAPEFDWAGASDDPNLIYVFGRPDENARTGVYLYDVTQGEYAGIVGTHDRVDVTHTFINPRTGRFLGHAYIDDRMHIVFEDDELNRIYRGVDDFFGGDASVMPRDVSARRMIFYVSGPQEPGVYYLFDREHASIDPIYSIRPGLPPEGLAEVEIIRYAARDGREITGYLTIPSRGMGQATPLVVMPHGGPEMRDMYDFDLFAQYYASRGYAVFQPNFRGSSGYGGAFARAGYREWGGAMQNDITDGVYHLMEQGRIARDRICIVGFSYGGYAALMGGATTPDLYQCVVAGAAVSDLPSFVNYWRDSDEEAHAYWVESIGDPQQERQRLYNTSPLNLADQITVPVFLFHGSADRIVPVSQSRNMADALEAAGVEHHYEEYRGSGHSLSPGAELRSIIVRSTELLDRTIGPDRFSGVTFGDNPVPEYVILDKPVSED